MKDYNGREIKIGDRVCWASDQLRGWKLGVVVQIVDDKMVTLSGPFWRSARGFDLVVESES